MIESKLKMKSKDNKVKIILFRQLFFQSLYTMRTETLKLTVYGLKPKVGTKIDMLFVKTETNTVRIGQFFCNIQGIL